MSQEPITDQLRGMTTLADALSDAPFTERHARVIYAPPAVVWAALMELRWTDLRSSKPLIIARSAGLRSVRPVAMVDEGPVVTVALDPERRWVGGRIGKPWRAVPSLASDPRSLEDLAAFGEPGWLKFGMEFVLEPLGADRTVVTTSTMCVATDEVAHRRFTRYWRLIRPFSGLLRLDMLAALARSCARMQAQPTKETGSTKEAGPTKEARSAKEAGSAKEPGSTSQPASTPAAA
jgi:hypothetical protein